MASEGLGAYREVEKLQRQTQFGIVMRAEKQRIGLAMMVKAIDVTPVDEGEARRGWHFASPRPDGVDKQSDNPLAELVDITNASAPEDPLYVENNVDHIRVLDDGTFDPPNPGPSKDPRKGRTGRTLVQGGFSMQAPKGITGVVVDQIATAFGLQKTTSVT